MAIQVNIAKDMLENFKKKFLPTFIDFSQGQKTPLQ